MEQLLALRQAPKFQIFKVIKADLYSLCDDPAVAFKVGKSKNIFEIHWSLICNASPVLKATLTRKFKETQRYRMLLPDEDVETFGHFAQWLYGKNPLDVSSYSDRVGKSSPFALPLAKLYVLAEKYNVDMLKNRVIDIFFEGHSACQGCKPMETTINYFYINSIRKSPFRRLLADWHAWHVPMKEYGDEDPADFLLGTPDFAIDVALAMAKRWGNSGAKDPFKGDPSVYYVRPSKTE